MPSHKIGNKTMAGYERETLQDGSVFWKRVSKSMKIRHAPMKGCSTMKTSKVGQVAGKFVCIHDDQTLKHCDSSQLASILSKPPIFKVPLKEEDQKSWLEFKKLDDGRPVPVSTTLSLTEGIWPINLDHPFVPVIFDFAVTAFNQLLEKHVKKDKSNKLCDPEVINCTYLNFSGDHYICMTIEAIEEGILGVYKTVVACDVKDGSRVLLRFVLTKDRPVGRIARMLPRLIRLKSRYKTLKGLKKDLEINLKTKHKSIQGKNKGKVAAAELIRLKEQYTAMKGICKALYWQIRRQIPETWNERSVPADGSSDYDYDDTSGLEPRDYDDTTCEGHDYYTRLGEYCFSGIWKW